MIYVDYSFHEGEEHSIEVTTDNYAFFKELLAMIQDRVRKGIDEEHATATEAYR